MGNLPDDPVGDVRTPPVSCSWPKRLGKFPFWRGAEHLLDVLEPVYRRAAQRGLEIFLGAIREERTP
jgi:uncharacterized Zn finger protein